MDSNTQFWIIKNGEMHGPFTLDELKSAQITPSTKIWYKDLKEWTAIENTPTATLLFPESGIAAEPKEETSPAPEEKQADEEPVNARQEDDKHTVNPPLFNRESYEAAQRIATIPPTPAQPRGCSQAEIDEAYRQGYKKGLDEGKMLDKDTDTSKCPPTNLVWAIVSTILCCLPVGVVAIVYASKVSGYYYRNEFVKAKKASDRALYWSLASFITWMVTYPIISALSVLTGLF